MEEYDDEIYGDEGELHNNNVVPDEPYVPDIIQGENDRPFYWNLPAAQRNEKKFRIKREEDPRSKFFFRLGAMNFVCQSCKAKHFPEERRVNGSYKDCCGYGKIKMPKVKQSRLINKLVLGRHRHSKHFMENIRLYQSQFKMCQLCGSQKMDKLTRRGVPFYT